MEALFIFFNFNIGMDLLWIYSNSKLKNKKIRSTLRLYRSQSWSYFFGFSEWCNVKKINIQNYSDSDLKLKNKIIRSTMRLYRSQSWSYFFGFWDWCNVKKYNILSNSYNNLMLKKIINTYM